MKKQGIYPFDFYVADLLSEEATNESIGALHTRLKGDHYEFDQKQEEDASGALNASTKMATFNDNQEAHKAFWKIYKRPPAPKYQDYIKDRRDLLFSRESREYQGAFYTPRMWADKSKEYLARLLGEDFQDNYFIWDLCAGTGNLLVGLNNPTNTFASTLDKNDIQIIKERATSPDKYKKLNIAEKHIFAFDFLHDPLDQVCAALQKILDNPKERAKLLIYINPPYAEAGNKSQMSGTGKNKRGVSCQKSPELQKFHAYTVYKNELGKARNEVFAQFFMRIVKEIAGGIEEKQDNEIQSKETPSEETQSVSAQPKEAPLAGEKPSAFLIHQDFKPQKRDLDVQYGLRASIGFFDHDELLNGGFAPSRGRINSTNSPLKIRGPLLCAFSKLKYLNSSNFKTFRQYFKARFLGGFMCPGNTFDNVKGSFPIGFLMWDLGAQG
ncbi:hypothetical protein [Helicobacter heilmannii]|uniref:hypothetical protein n=1 Tax=Helicobacter heilmannii TaxID=35817 RepID=UPI0006A017D6|nr:hypothetical protein [Helicobacter heilmannii]CRF46596.1 FIG00711868: hypothetical protein [Helicobacter heilmannii]